MTLSQETLTLLALVGVAMGALGLASAVVLSGRLRRLRESYAVLQGGGSGEDFVTAVGRQVTATQDLSEQVVALRQDVATVARALQRAVQRVGVVRFDAFEDMGGQLSFSAAMLDAVGDGLVLTTINGRTESRFYAKPIEGGDSRYHLSEEEREAVRRALEGPRR